MKYLKLLEIFAFIKRREDTENIFAVYNISEKSTRQLKNYSDGEFLKECV